MNVGSEAREQGVGAAVVRFKPGIIPNNPPVSSANARTDGYGVTSDTALPTLVSLPWVPASAGMTGGVDRRERDNSGNASFGK